MAKTVLIADDEEVIRNTLSDIMEVLDYDEDIDVLTAEDGQIAHDMLLKEKVDLLITDLNMPNLEGNDLIQKIITEFPEEQKPKKIIVISGYLDMAQKDDEVEYVSFFAKPINMEEFEERVVKYLEHLDS
jgi:YesN/AraC family two-component response regulator